MTFRPRGYGRTRPRQALIERFCAIFGGVDSHKAFCVAQIGRSSWHNLRSVGEFPDSDLNAPMSDRRLFDHLDHFKDAQGPAVLVSQPYLPVDEELLRLCEQYASSRGVEAKILQQWEWYLPGKCAMIVFHRKGLDFGPNVLVRPTA